MTNFCFCVKIVEYWRNRTQRMNKERFVAANLMALVTHGLVSFLQQTPFIQLWIAINMSFTFLLQTQPLDLVKVRSQMLQEGKLYTGIAF